MEGVSANRLDRPRATTLRPLLVRSLRHHAWLLAFCLGYVAVTSAALVVAGLPLNLLMTSYLASTAIPPLAAVLFVAIGQLAYHAGHVRPFAPGKALLAVTRDERLSVNRALFALVPVLLIPIFASAFTSFKNAIPFIVPFSYDTDLMLLDRALHFGHDPWRLLQPLLGQPLISSIVSYLYNLWFPLMYLILYWQIFSQAEPATRMRYLLSFALLWALAGSLFALGLSSAGPCFYGAVTGAADPFRELLDYLSAANQQFKNWSLDAQAYLWAGYRSGEIATGSGISAMPSMHVAVAVLQALLGWRLNRRLGVLLTAYAAIVMIGSVHLGWHYAVDGYAGALAALAAWLIVGRVLAHYPVPSWDRAGDHASLAVTPAPGR